MKRNISSPTGLSPAEKEIRQNSPTMESRRGSMSSEVSGTSTTARRELDRALAFSRPQNGPMKDRITIDILRIDGEDFKGTVTPREAKNKIFVDALGLERGNLHGLEITFKGHPVITFRLREQINVDTTFTEEDFVFERDTANGKAIVECKIRGLRVSHQQAEAS